MTIAFTTHLLNIAAVDLAVRGGHADYRRIALARKCHLRTIHRYVAFLLRELDAPLAWSVERQAYRYSRPWNFGKALLAWLERKSK